MIHAITVIREFDKARKRQKRLRLCPNCRTRQITPEEKTDEPVSCQKCGAEIHPKRVESEGNTEG